MPETNKPWANSPSGTMRAMVLVTRSSSTSPEHCFKYVDNYPKPSLPGPEWLLVKVHATGLNRAELRARAGEPNVPPEWGPWVQYWRADAPIPDVIGEEFVGVVEEAGSTAAAADASPMGGWKKGDRVAACYYGGGKAYDGAYAEYTVVHHKLAFRLPGPDEMSIARASEIDSGAPVGNQISWADLGAVPGSAWTAWGSLFQSASTQSGQTVFIHGGTSSVGVWAVLLAKHKGCTVIATTRQEAKVAKLKAAGADHVIVERGPGNDPEEYGRMVDEIHTVAPNGVNTFLSLVNPNSIVPLAFKCTAPYGYIVTTGVLSKIWSMGSFTPVMIPTTRRMTMHAGIDCVDQIEECMRVVCLGIRDGIFKREVFCDSIFRLEGVGQAHVRAEANEATGKVVIDISA